MRRTGIVTLALFAVSILLSGLIVGGNTATLQRGKLKAEVEAMKKGEPADDGALGNALNWSQSMPELHLLMADGCELCGLDADHIFIKPDTEHRVCLYIDNISFDDDIETIHFLLTWDASIQFTDLAGPTFDCTDFDSSGWDLKHHIYLDGGSGEDSLEVWIISGGNALEPLSKPGCILNIDFHTYSDLTPGLHDTIHFEFAEYNETRFEATFDFYKTINRPPVISWEGVDAPDTIDAIYFQESHYYEVFADAHDWDIDCNHPKGDVILLWAQTDTLCPWSDGCTFCGRSPGPGPPYVIPPFSGVGYVQAAFKCHPPKLGECDNFWVDFIAMSTHETGQPLYDTLSVHFIIEDCAYQFAWMTPPPGWDDPDENEPLPTSWPYYDVYACQFVEIPVGMHIDYDYLLDEPIWSVYLELDYDNRMEVFEVGNEGLITEHLGPMAFNVIEDYTSNEGKIIVSMAFNYPLQWPPYPLPPDSLNPPFGFVVSDWYKLLYVGFQVPDYLPDSTLLKLTMEQCRCKVNEKEYKCCSVPLTYLHVRDFAVSGNVYYSDTCIPVPGVTISTLDSCGGAIYSRYTTDASGAFRSRPMSGCEAFCLEPSKATERNVWQQVVTSYDATLLLRALCGAFFLSHNDSLAADVTGDGTVSAFDASVVLKWIVCNYCGTELIPNEIIGTWIFESVDCSNCGTGPWGPACVCNESITQDENICFEGVIVGDVSQNWPGPPSQKIVADGLKATFSASDMTISFVEPVSAVDMVVTFGTNLTVVDVSTVNGIMEWRTGSNELRVVAASAKELGNITIIFERMIPTEFEIVARADENLLMATTVKAVPLPTEYHLAQNFPNPFNPVTTIDYTLPEAAKVKVEVYNIMGQLVDILINTEQKAGYHTIRWNATEQASGIYFYRLETGNFSATKRMVFMK